MKEESVFNSIPKINYTEPAPETDATAFETVVRSRRSVRVYTDEKIPTDIVNKCLDLALLAPNSSNLQQFEFYWVKSPDKKEKLVEYCLGQAAAKTAQELFVCVARTKTYKKHCKEMLKTLEASGEPVPPMVQNYYSKLAPFVYNQGPLGIFGLIKRIVFPIIGIFKVIPRGPSSEHGMQMWASKSASLACENLMLAFRAYGYDTCPMEGFDEVRTAKLLDLPGDAFPVMVISAGKRAPNGIYGKQIRFNRDWFIREC